jgi:hypothetical protein
MLEDFSNPHTVYKKAREIFGPNVMIQPSTRAAKKYMIYNPAADQWIHFGQYGYEDWTKHRSTKRRDAFRIRNKKWANSNHWTPAWLSYNLLW